MYVKNCDIAGNTEYIYGGNKAYFEDCNLIRMGFFDGWEPVHYVPATDIREIMRIKSRNVYRTFDVPVSDGTFSFKGKVWIPILRRYHLITASNKRILKARHLHYNKCRAFIFFYITYFITFAGVPTATAFSGISFVTTAPAPITALSPIIIPGSIIAPAPIHTRLPILTGNGMRLPRFSGFIS